MVTFGSQDGKNARCRGQDAQHHLHTLVKSQVKSRAALLDPMGWRKNYLPRHKEHGNQVVVFLLSHVAVPSIVYI